jgi:hypothetical protein
MTTLNESEICKNIITIIKNLTKILSKKLPENVDIDRLKSLMKLSFMLNDDIIMSIIVPKIWRYRLCIITKDEKSIHSDDFALELIPKNNMEEYSKRLFKLIKNVFFSSSREEKDVIWSQVRLILKYSILYIKLKPIDEAEKMLLNVNLNFTFN